MINLIRCDERLIHGQCITQIVKVYDIEEIIVIDDVTAENTLLKRIITMAVPKNMKAQVLTFNDSVNKVKDALTNSSKTLILMKTPGLMFKLLQEIPGLPRELNIASLSPQKTAEPCIEIVPATYFTIKEFTTVEQLAAADVRVWFQMIPSSSRCEWAEIRDKIKQKFNKYQVEI